MKILENAWETILGFVPFTATLVVVIGVLYLIDRIARRRMQAGASDRMFAHQITMLVLSLFGLVVVILALPADAQTRNQLLSLVGVALTAVIALSSTTIVSNAVAGILLRSMSRFRPGDFIRVGEHLGRVTERGLFHTEVQTEDRDLATFPNYYLVSNPLKVVRSSGTIISATVSLGYDVPHGQVRELLSTAATNAGLADPFTHVTELGNFAVTYRVAGFLEDVRQLISASSKLRTAMLDALHGADIEIVSPSFMNQRPLRPDERVIAEGGAPDTADDDAAENVVMFDKAEAAARVEELRTQRAELVKDVEEMKSTLESAEDGQRPRIERGLRFREQRLAAIDAEIAGAEEHLKSEG